MPLALGLNLLNRYNMGGRKPDDTHPMPEQLFHLELNIGQNLRQQIHQQLVQAIECRQLPKDRPLPSSRRLAEQLGVSRNTVIRVYEQLISEGLIVARERSGYFPSPHIAHEQPTPTNGHIQWSEHLVSHPSEQRNIVKPRHWQRYRYPFVYGQFDGHNFALPQWRECSRDATNEAALRQWASDQLLDDPMLIEHIQSRILPSRGIWAKPEQILITCGAQHGVYLSTQLILPPGGVFGIEDPNYVDVRNIALNRPAELQPIPVDTQGLQVDDPHLARCDCVYLTPSHQFPTTVTLSLARRKKLLARAQRENFVIIEDDYEAEANFTTHPSPALKSIDDSGHVIYVGSFSKTLAPGLRMGYLVADEAFIREAHALRRLMLRHAPMNNQRTVALFIARGYFDNLVKRQSDIYKARWQIMNQALQTHLPNSTKPPTFGGSSFWVQGPKDLNARDLAQRAQAQSILIEPGEVYYCQQPKPEYFKLSYSSIATEHIEEGIEALAKLIPH